MVASCTAGTFGQMFSVPQLCVGESPQRISPTGYLNVSPKISTYINCTCCAGMNRGCMENGPDGVLAVHDIAASLLR